MIRSKCKIPFHTLLLLSLSLLLCACQPDKTGPVSPEPSMPNKLSPQQLLEEQPIDDTHDAFLVDTGGELGTLLITVELENSTGSSFMLHFSVWDPAHMETPIQTMTKNSDCFHSHEIMDANFDGYMDFGYVFSMGNMPYYEHLWIWDEPHQQFVNVPEFDEISVPELISETETIYGFNRGSSGGTGLHTFHQWVDGHLICVRQIEIETSIPHEAVCMSIRDRIGTELVEIYHEDFSQDSSGWHDAEMVWHDLNYHGEPGGLYDIFQQQKIDDRHDAFFVSTNGALGTLLVTAELAEESKGEFGIRDITFSVWNPAEMEEPIQTFSAEVMMGVAPEFHHVVDANFDDFQDFGYLFHAGNQPNYWHYWLWNEEQAQFTYCASLIEISQPVFHADRQIVTGWARNSAASGVTTFYQWINGELTLLRKIERHYPTEDTQLATVEDLIDGKMVEVYRKEWDLSELKEGDPLVGSEWYDLNYHGEP